MADPLYTTTISVQFRAASQEEAQVTAHRFAEGLKNGWGMVVQARERAPINVPALDPEAQPS